MKQDRTFPRRQQALPMKAQLLKLMHWPQYMIKIRSSPLDRDREPFMFKNLLLVNENIKQPCTAGQVQTEETLFARLDIWAGAGRPETRTTATPTWYDIETIQRSMHL